MSSMNRLASQCRSIKGLGYRDEFVERGSLECAKVRGGAAILRVAGGREREVGRSGYYGVLLRAVLCLQRWCGRDRCGRWGGVRRGGGVVVSDEFGSEGCWNLEIVASSGSQVERREEQGFISD
ncbi:hypothetical protein CHS0354_005906 [Potamilus streckersoni]|uniref:Uncharacterized protein n=1 Tax=Potamilus streckersoni TaxID=2493646 RepID=A0AAE0T262_9BIVA|nr:hypothetical protein CHS0354_005906 [Potamilus streckersoni]